MNSDKFIPSLTPLRGIACVLVVLSHAHLLFGILFPANNLLVSKFYLMVDLFFVLSGFMMCHMYGNLFEKGIGKKDFWAYIKIRFARIYPLHLFMFLFVLVLFIALKIRGGQLQPYVLSAFDIKAIPAQLALVNAWGMHFQSTWNVSSWSVSVDLFLYLVFPLLMFFMYKYARAAKWTLIIFVAGSAIFLMYYMQPIYEANMAKSMGVQLPVNRPLNTIQFFTGWALLRGACSFIVGMLAYEVYKSGKYIKFFSSSILFLGLVLFFMVMWIGDYMPDVISIFIFGIFIVNTANLKGRLKKMMNSRLWNYLGDRSYSIYMVHVPLMILFLVVSEAVLGAEYLAQMEKEMKAHPNYLQNWGTAILFLLVSVGLGALVYRYVENPARKYLRKRL
jgi:peptidoglycan/LPS O-acetylase OafA/YrhL